MTQILCRLDHEGKPVVFVAESLHNGRLKAWTDGDEKPRTVGVDYYQATKPLSDADSQVIAKRYAQATKDATVIVRQRLPRVYKTLPNILAGATEVATQVAKKQTGKKGKSSARAAAAKRQMEKELQQTGQPAASTAPDMSQPAQNGAQATASNLGLSPDDEKFKKLVLSIAEILKPML